MSTIENKTVSERILVSSDEVLIAKAMETAEEFVKQFNLESKKALHIRLLTEEVLEMVKSMVQGYTADFWLEGENDEIRICLEAKANINIAREKELMSASKDGKNILVKGFTAKLAQFMTHHKEYINELLNAGDSYMNYIPSDYLCIHQTGGYFATTEVMWSMVDYRNYLYDAQTPANEQIEEQIEEQKDELEKSIVANIADDVKVGVKGDHVTMIAIKKI